MTSSGLNFKNLESKQSLIKKSISKVLQRTITSSDIKNAIPNIDTALVKSEANSDQPSHKL